MELPEKLSDLLNLALDDLGMVEADPKYKVVMIEWHSPSPSRTHCQVCLAGAVMAKSLGVPPEALHAPADFAADVCDKLKALDALRLGTVELAFNSIRVAPPFGNRRVPTYELDPKGWHIAMRQLATDLADSGY
jgi:hypothetical protein